MTTLTRTSVERRRRVSVFASGPPALERRRTRCYGPRVAGSCAGRLHLMPDSLLTIDEATRAFRTSPKTIRRRLAAGEIPGAYKRPGGRGPEWVMPEGSLLAAGFTPRAAGLPKEIPEDPAEQAAYWERRAEDAEAALAATASSSRVGSDAGRRSSWIGVLLLAGVVSLLSLAFLAGRLTGDGDEGAARPQPGAELVRSMVAARTQAGETVGVVGDVPSNALPADRRLRELDGTSGTDHPRYVVVHAGLEAGDASGGALSRPADLLLAVPAPDGAGTLRLYDTGRSGSAPASPGADDATADRTRDSAATDGEAPAGDPPDRSTGPEADGVRAQDQTGEGSSPPAVTPEPKPASPELVSVQAGDSFWSVAVEMVSADGEASEAEIAQYWSALVDANSDRLLDPGNPDLLHVGQDLVLPPVR